MATMTSTSSLASMRASRSLTAQQAPLLSQVNSRAVQVSGPADATRSGIFGERVSSATSITTATGILPSPVLPMDVEDFTRSGGATTFREAMKVKVPAAEFVATGDIDGDGKAEFAGSGRTALWVALSGHRPEARATGSLQFSRMKLTHPVINEVMSSNQQTFVGSVGDRYPDWVELYNPTDDANRPCRLEINLDQARRGDRIVHVPGGRESAEHGKKAHSFANNPAPNLCTPATDFQTAVPPFACSMAPATSLIPSSIRARKMTLPTPVLETVCRPLPPPRWQVPALPMFATGPIAPSLKFRGFDTKNFTADSPLRLFAEADDDSAVIGVSLSWRRIDIANAPWHRVVFYDDGEHSDGLLADGLFSGTLAPGLPDGARIEFYVEATDANNTTVYCRRPPTLPKIPAEMITTCSGLEEDRLQSRSPSCG